MDSLPAADLRLRSHPSDTQPTIDPQLAVVDKQLAVVDKQLAVVDKQLAALARFRAVLTPAKLTEINKEMTADPNLLTRAAELLVYDRRPTVTIDVLD